MVAGGQVTSGTQNRGRIPVVGLTGGIGAGKSEVARILRELGCVVVNSDELGHRALRDPAVRDTIAQWWPGAIGDGGEVDRKALAKIVFADPAQRRRLESLTHPWIESKRKAIFEAAPAGAQALVIDAPLLLEAGIDRECDAVWFIESPRNQRLERVRSRRGWDEAELDRRERFQLPLDEKRSRADDVISNEGDLDALAAQVTRALQRILQSRRS